MNEREELLARLDSEKDKRAYIWYQDCKDAAAMIRALAPDRTAAGQESSSALKTGPTVSATAPDPASAAAPMKGE